MKITEKIKIAMCGLAVAMVGATTLMPAASVSAESAVDATIQTKAEKAKGFLGSSEQNSDLMGTLQAIVNVVIGIIGFVAVVMTVIGGFQYTLSAGDAGKVKKAKDTILYGIIGLVVALLSFAIVNFVLTNVLK